MRRGWFRSALSGVLVLAVLGFVPAPSFAAPADDSATSEPAGPTDAPASDSPASASPSSTTSQPADPEPACEGQLPPAQFIEEPGWTQPMYAAPEKIWPWSTGKGVTVAVIDTGVEATNQQLAGAVDPGFDLVRNVPEGDVDCVGLGTGLAGVIAAREQPGIGFYGLAPDSRILPIRVRVAAGDNTEHPLTPDVLASALDQAVDGGAEVVLFGMAVTTSSPALEAAVLDARQRGAVIVAPVGDQHPGGDYPPNDPSPGAVTPYPAAIDGVIGVGAIDQDGMKLPESQNGTYVDLVGPGVAVTASGVQGQAQYDGTAIAAGFVAAGAALLLGADDPRFAGLNGTALSDAVAQRLIDYSSPAAGDVVLADGTITNIMYGSGLVDPYRALTEQDGSGGVVDVPPVTTKVASPDELAAARRDDRDASIGSIAAWLAIGGSIAVATMIALGRRARTTRWRVTQEVDRDDAAPEHRPEYVAGEALFAPRKLD